MDCLVKGVDMVTPELINRWAILPRLMMATFTVLSWKSCLWFMSLPDPTPSQSAYVSIITGCASGAFAIWINKETK